MSKNIKVIFTGGNAPSGKRSGVAYMVGQARLDKWEKEDKFDMEVEFPTIHYSQQNGESYRALLNGSLVIHRVKLNFGANGLYSTTLDRVGKPTYTETWEPTISDQYGANRVQINDQATQTIPAYEKNKNFT